MTACPISKQHIDSNVARINGFFSLVFIALGMKFQIFWLLLMLDFIPRSFFIKYSPIANLSKMIVNKFGISPKPIDAAPKKFAAQIGLMMSVVLIVLSYTAKSEFSFYFSVFFAVPVFLETFFGYCLGCKIYSVLLKMNLIKHKLNDSDFSNLS